MTLVHAISAGASAAPGPLAAERWRHRVLILFADAPDDLSLARQRDILGGVVDGLRRRDVRVIEVVGERTEPGMDAASLRADFARGGGFAAVLVGKDGGAKLHRRAPITATGLFATIDSMPMARHEAAGRTAP